MLQVDAFELMKWSAGSHPLDSDCQRLSLIAALGTGNQPHLSLPSLRFVQDRSHICFLIALFLFHFTRVCLLLSAWRIAPSTPFGDTLSFYGYKFHSQSAIEIGISLLWESTPLGTTLTDWHDSPVLPECSSLRIWWDDSSPHIPKPTINKFSLFQLNMLYFSLFHPYLLTVLPDCKILHDLLGIQQSEVG